MKCLQKLYGRKKNLITESAESKCKFARVADNKIRKEKYLLKAKL